MGKYNIFLILWSIQDFSSAKHTHIFTYSKYDLYCYIFILYTNAESIRIKITPSIFSHTLADILTLWHLLEEDYNFAKDKFIIFFLVPFFWSFLSSPLLPQCHNIFPVFYFNIFIFELFSSCFNSYFICVVYVVKKSSSIWMARYISVFYRIQ